MVKHVILLHVFQQSRDRISREFFSITIDFEINLHLFVSIHFTKSMRTEDQQHETEKHFLLICPRLNDKFPKRITRSKTQGTLVKHMTSIHVTLVHVFSLHVNYY